MENIRKYLDYLESSTEEEFNYSVLRETLENVVNKLLNLPKDKDQMYLKIIRHQASVAISFALENYSFEGEDICVFELEKFNESLFLEWLKSEIKDKYDNLKKIKNTANPVYLLFGLIDKEDFYKWGDEKIANGYFHYDYDKDISPHLYYFNNYVAINTNTFERDEAFEWFRSRVMEFRLNLLHYVKLLYADFDIPLDSSSEQDAIDRPNHLHPRGRIKLISLGKERFNSSLNQSQLAILFGKLKQKKVLADNNTKIAQGISFINGCNDQNLRAYLGGESNLKGSGAILSKKEQVEDIQNILKEIIDELDKEKKHIPD